jgi:hypothetical protein
MKDSHESLFQQVTKKQNGDPGNLFFFPFFGYRFCVNRLGEIFWLKFLVYYFHLFFCLAEVVIKATDCLAKRNNT